MKTILQLREYKQDCTVSTVYLPNGEEFKILEDIGRPTGVKIPGETCIPEGAYTVELTFSNRFQKTLPLLGNKRDEHGNLIVDLDGVKFTGVRVHGGNTTEDTEGCLLAAVHHSNNKVWNCKPAMSAIIEFLRNNTNCMWVITRGSKC